MPLPSGRLPLASLLLVSWLALAAAGAAATGPALVVAEGSVARGPVAALGRDLVVAGEALSDVAVLGGDADVDGRIRGDLILLGGGARLHATARVEGDVFALGGEVTTEPGAWVGGRTASYPTFSSAWLTLLEGPSLGGLASSRLVVGAKLALLAAWLTLCLFLLATSARGVLSTSESVRQEPFRNFLVGLTAILAMVMAGLFFSAFAAVLVGVPMLVLVGIAALLLKLWGMVAVFHALGSWVLGDLRHRRVAPLEAALAGLAVLGVLKLVPWVGVWVWTAATIVGVGAALTTKLGRREPWFEVVSGAPPATA